MATRTNKIAEFRVGVKEFLDAFEELYMQKIELDTLALTFQDSDITEGDVTAAEFGAGVTAVGDIWAAFTGSTYAADLMKLRP